MPPSMSWEDDNGEQGFNIVNTLLYASPNHCAIKEHIFQLFDQNANVSSGWLVD